MMVITAKALKATGLAVFPCWARLNTATNRWDKGPAVPKGESWKVTALRSINDPLLDWSSAVVGLPIPERVLLLDLDTYKGITRGAVENYLGVGLEWDRAFIQRTISGGEHYAFRCEWPARQLSPLDGLDTRTSGKGFICSGKGYESVGFGPFALAYPDSLPQIPDCTRKVFGDFPPSPPSSSFLTPSESATHTDEKALFDALKYLDPGCPRADWVLIGLALRKFYAEEPSKGVDVFDRWSSGAFWPNDPPTNYIPEHIATQWESFKPEGRTTVATLFYKAIRNGWSPPRSFDVATAFGPQAAPTEVFNGLVDRVLEVGGDVKQTAALIEAIRTSGCNALQVGLLTAELKSTLKHAGITGKTVTASIDVALAPSQTEFYAGQYGKNDTDNAAIFLSKHYANNTLIKSDGELYAYGGRAWEKISADVIKHQVAVDMSRERMQASRVNSCIDLVVKLSPVHDGVINKHTDRGIAFHNGVFDLASGNLTPHRKEDFSTVVLPYDYDPSSSCPNWLAFLSASLESDLERIALLQEWLGYLLSNDYKHHKILLLLGPKRCGKGTIGRVIQALVGGQNFTGGSLSSFARDSFIDSLRTKPVLFIGDAAKRVSSNIVNQVIERIKSISGGDAVDFDRKFIAGLSETLPTRVTIASNGIPNLFDDSGALASRIMPLPFYTSFFDNEDLHLIDRLLPEIAGIAIWAIEGLRRLVTNGSFTRPAVSIEEQAQLSEAYSPLTQFITQCCVLNYRASCSESDLYAAYRMWCLSHNEDVLRPKVLISSLKDALRSRGVRYNTLTRSFSGFSVASSTSGTSLRLTG